MRWIIAERMYDRDAVSLKPVLAVMPFSAALLGVIVANVPVSFTGGIVPPPVLALMPIYYWCLVRPDLMPPFAVLVHRRLAGLLSGGPPGVWTVSFVAAYALVDRERESFAGLVRLGAILGFAAAMLVAGATAYRRGRRSLLASSAARRRSCSRSRDSVFYIPICLLIGLHPSPPRRSAQERF